MEKLVSYLRSVIKPVGDNEFCLTTEWPINLVQDSIVIVPKSVKTPPNTEWIYLGEWKLCRNSVPRNIAWLNEATMKFEWDLSDKPIYRRLIPPPYESLDHTRIIMNIIEITGGHNKTYLEYGVRSGSSIEPISSMVSSAIGVDIVNYKPRGSNIMFFQSTTDDFSNKILNQLSFHYAFIDADHSSKQVLKDFANIFARIETGGYIFLHDTYPCMEEMIQPRFCNDCYLSPLHIKKEYDVELVTLPLNPGLTLIRKK